VGCVLFVDAAGGGAEGISAGVANRAPENHPLSGHPTCTVHADAGAAGSSSDSPAGQLADLHAPMTWLRLADPCGVLSSWTDGRLQIGLHATCAT
jgi:hypothetical protein